MRKIFYIILFSLIVFTTTGCSLTEDIKTDIEREVKNEGKKIVKKQVDKAFNELEKKTAKRAGKIKVDEVIDGDTFKSNGQTYRMVLIDTPETVHPTKAEQPYGKEASSYVRQRLSHQMIEIEYDAQEKDRYGRHLVYVWLHEKNFNAELVEKGYARVMSIAPNTRYLDEFEKLEAEAKSKKLGLWQYTNY